MPEDRNARTQWWIVTRGPFLESPKDSSGEVTLIFIPFTTYEKISLTE